ncbi:DJ-1/PfpI family protein [Actinocatenispora rupis]|uniref:AraC family transcriptional regulator n=1 Tax=Actinocatenispora rupis TaxID=519421 RepID=A0A8J3N971_9ACTN|nr:DJ-1/PfpI family protein [Actinocatenispora rupis]GID11044.1 AraC family transcriptional regulator [Actinocatenispora rupis]
MTRHRVALAVADQVPIYEAAVPCEVFGRPRPDIADPWHYDFRVCSADPGRTRTGGGFLVDTGYGLAELAAADTVIVPACADPRVPQPPGLVAAVRTAYEAGARIVSLCTGAFVLAEAGLLDGRRATTHWMHARTLATRYPAVTVDETALYVDEGDVLTSAGTAAGMDLCLHLVRLDLGAEIANLLARRLVTPPHRTGGQAQYVEAPVPARDDDSLAPLLDWALAHLHEPLTIADLARHEHLTPRTLIRRFRAATGTAPLRWLLTQRVQRARTLLESTSEPLGRIADECGLGSEANLRHHFTRLVGVEPTPYRRTFRARQSR